jgi:hypothetical protein
MLTRSRKNLDSLYGYLLGHPSAVKGGYARAQNLTASRRKEIARKAAQARWSERVSTPEPSEEPLVSMDKHIRFGV